MNNKTKLATAIAAAIFSVSASYADDSADKMEKCKVVDAKGKGMIKEHKADCGGSNHSSCSGTNEAGDPKAWILVPKGECAKINKGDFAGVSKETMDKLEIKEEK